MSKNAPLLSALFLLLWCNVLAAGDSYLTNSLQPVFDKDGNASRGAWVNGANGGSAKRVKGTNIISMTLNKREQMARIAFHEHMPFDASLATDDPTSALQVKVRSKANYTGNITWGWHIKDNKYIRAPASQINLTANTWQELLLPMTPAFKCENAIAIFFELDTPGTLEMNHVAVVSKRRLCLDAIPADIFLNADSLKLNGKAVAGINTVELTGKPLMMTEQRRCLRARLMLLTVNSR
ncbi:MAG: hypothetical protein JXR97_02850 [Planctomycetes bacterium]|nr:hypothetical protein [Planctomycetota bacterium]